MDIFLPAIRAVEKLQQNIEQLHPQLGVGHAGQNGVGLPNQLGPIAFGFVGLVIILALPEASRRALVLLFTRGCLPAIRAAKSIAL